LDDEPDRRRTLTDVSTIERAMELARSGAYHSIEDIRRTLKREGADGVEQHLAGVTLRKQLKALMVSAKVKPVPAHTNMIGQ
jgi:hypothetical protein